MSFPRQTTAFPNAAPAFVNPLRSPRLLPGLLALGLAGPVLAQEQASRVDAPTVYAEAGWAAHATRSTAVGITWPWSFEQSLWGGQLTAHWDAFVGQGRAYSPKGDGTRYTLTQLALVPMLRLRFDVGRSPWFAQAGIGLSVTDTLYESPDKTFSTRFNFSDHLALGRNFGARRQHEVILGLRHVSNAGIKKPNPGEDFVQLRYARAF